jgi:hypothetical protein
MLFGENRIILNEKIKSADDLLGRANDITSDLNKRMSLINAETNFILRMELIYKHIKYQKNKLILHKEIMSEANKLINECQELQRKKKKWWRK